MNAILTTPRTADLLTLPEAAAYLNMTEKALRWQRYTGEAPRAAKIGGRVMFRKRDVDAWLDAKFDEVSA
ncbi:helix-turn-helix transcriptional regulator [Brachybacterium tyrofermentans]|uniref:helix-turn-helix transcriptional regulator n=1 Tax=Brachybacterium tyrofermentans TaxID=47848 RepID=UPI003FCF1DAC